MRHDSFKTIEESDVGALYRFESDDLTIEIELRKDGPPVSRYSSELASSECLGDVRFPIEMEFMINGVEMRPNKAARVIAHTGRSQKQKIWSA